MPSVLALSTEARNITAGAHHKALQHQYLIMIEAFHQICSVDLVNLANTPTDGMFTLGN
jgi:hypothetical protein